MKYILKIILFHVLICFSLVAGADNKKIDAEDLSFTVETLYDGLAHPWGMTFLPDGNILVTERPGYLRLINSADHSIREIKGLPDIAVVGQGGLLDVALHPEFDSNQLVYLSYAARGDGGYGTEVLRGRLSGNSLTDTEVIFRALPKQGGGRHFGSRFLFAPDGSLFISLGDRGERDNGQDTTTHAGSLIRVNPDGSVP